MKILPHDFRHASIVRIAAIIVGCLALTDAMSNEADWITPAETSHFKTTPSYVRYTCVSTTARRRGTRYDQADALRRFAGRPRSDARRRGERRRIHAGSRAKIRQADSDVAGRHPFRRDRRQGRGHDAAARSDRREKIAASARSHHSGLSADLQRRWPREFVAVHAHQSERSRIDGIPRNGAEPQSQSRLSEGRCAGNAGVVGVIPRMAAGFLRRHPHHQRRRLSVRPDVVHRRLGSARCERESLARRGAQAARVCGDGKTRPSAFAISGTQRSSRYQQGHREFRIGSAFLDGLRRAAESRRAARRNAHVEAVRQPRAFDVRPDRLDSRRIPHASGRVAQSRGKSGCGHDRAQSRNGIRHRVQDDRHADPISAQSRRLHANAQRYLERHVDSIRFVETENDRRSFLAGTAADPAHFTARWLHHSAGLAADHRETAAARHRIHAAGESDDVLCRAISARVIRCGRPRRSKDG